MAKQIMVSLKGADETLVDKLKSVAKKESDNSGYEITINQVIAKILREWIESKNNK